MTDPVREDDRWWIWPLAAVAFLAAVAAVYFLIPVAGVFVRNAGNVINSGETSAVRIFLVTAGGRSPLVAVGLVILQALLFPIADIPVLRTTGLMWGPVVGSLINWVGLVAGASLLFALARGLVGIPVRRSYPLKKAPLGIATLVMLGLRLVPFVPQDLLSIVAGCTRVRYRDFLIATAIGVAPASVVYATWAREIPSTGTQALTWGGTVIGLGLLGVLAWQYRSHIPFGTLSAERKRNMIAGIVVVAAAVLAYMFIPSFKAGINDATTRIAAGDITAVRDYLLSFGWWAPVVSALLMILQSVLAPLPAFVITFSNGMLFGWAWGALLSWSSAMAGAALCFYLARSLGRPAVEKLVGGSTALAISDRFFDRFGERAVLIARLLPFVSFDLISYGAGLTSMRFWPFFIATGIGQLPATLVYSYLGQNMSGSIRIVFFTFVITIAIFAAIAGARPLFMGWLQRDKDAAAAAAAQAEAEGATAALPAEESIEHAGA